MKAGPTRLPNDTSEGKADVNTTSKLVLPKSTGHIGSEQNIQAFREHLSATFEALESWPESYALSFALARSHSILFHSGPTQSDPLATFRLFLSTQHQQIRQAFHMLSKGAPISDVVVALTAPELFPPECKDLLPIVRDEIMNEIGSSLPAQAASRCLPPEIDSMPSPSGNGAMGVRVSPDADLGLIFSAFDAAFGKLVAEFARPDFIRDAQDKWKIPALPEAYFGALRHSHGAIEDPLRLGRSIASDIRWTAISLFLTGYSSDAVAAAILLHAANHLQPSELDWLHNTAAGLSARTAELVSMVQSSYPDPVTAPQEVSDLNFQRPPRFASPDALNDPDVKAIACASMLSPAWLSCELGLDRVGAQSTHAQTGAPLRLSSYLSRLLEFSSLMRDASIPPEFALRFQDRLEAFLPGRSLSGGAFSLDSSHPFSVRLTEMNAVLSVFKTLFSTTNRDGSQELLMRCMSFAAELTVRILAKQAPLRAVSQALAHPCLDNIAPDDRERAWRVAHEHIVQLAREASRIFLFNGRIRSTFLFPPHMEQTLVPPENELGTPLSKATVAEAQQLITAIAERIAGTISANLRKTRQNLGFYSTLDHPYPDTSRSGHSLFEILVPTDGAPSNASAWQAWLNEHRHELFKRIKQAALTSQLTDPQMAASLHAALKMPEAPQWALEEGSYVTTRGEIADAGSHNSQPSAAQVARLASDILFPTLSLDVPALPDSKASFSCLQSVKADSLEHAWHLLVHMLSRDRRILATALRMDEANGSPLVPVDLYHAEDLEKMSRAASLMVELLSSDGLTKTPRNRLQSFRHVLEVGITLALAGAHRDVVIAGFLHDLYELSPPEALSTWQSRVRADFGADVDALVQLVTEQRDPEKGSETPFLERKMGIFKNVQGALETDPFLARRAAHVLLAAKISTLNEGIRYLRERGDTKPWSQGSYTDNLQMMAATRQVADAICAKQDLLSGLFDRLLQQWIAAARTGRAQADVGRQYLMGVEVQPDLARGFELAKNAVRLGRSDTKPLLAWCYLEGKGTPRDFETALALFQEAADEGSSEAYFYLGLIHQSERYGMRQDYSAAATYFELAVKGGYHEALAYLGHLHITGLGVPKNPELAVRHFRSAANLFIPYGAYNLAACLENGDGVKRDVSEALRWYLKACSQGFPRAISRLSDIYYYGLPEVKKDYSKAAVFLEKSAALGDPDAKFKLGFMHHHGLGVPQDARKALRLFSSAAEQGNVLAHTNLCMMFFHGIGTPKDLAKAAHHGRIASEGNSSVALNQLAYMHEMGLGVRKSLAKAIDLYCRAALLGNAWALFRMGRCYAEGTGVKQDFPAAQRLVRQAADKGSEEARNYLKTMMPQEKPFFLVGAIQRAAMSLLTWIFEPRVPVQQQPPDAVEAPPQSP